MRIIFHSVPEHVKRLRISRQQLASPKFICSSPTSPTSPLPGVWDIQGLVVSASAMKDEEKRALSLAYAAAVSRDYTVRKDTHTMIDKAFSAFRPCDGGEVTMCDKCAERERKRAARKKSQTAEEREFRKKFLDCRMLIFNCPEILDMEAVPDYRKSPSLSLDKQVYLSTRITCYCRHHQEKLGYCVILTVKDQMGHDVCQGISTSIMITDDHKSAAGLGMKRDFDTCNENLKPNLINERELVRQTPTDTAVSARESLLEESSDAKVVSSQPRRTVSRDNHIALQKMAPAAPQCTPRTPQSPNIAEAVQKDDSSGHGAQPGVLTQEGKEQITPPSTFDLSSVGHDSYHLQHTPVLQSGVRPDLYEVLIKSPGMSIGTVPDNRFQAAAMGNPAWPFPTDSVTLDGFENEPRQETQIVYKCVPSGGPANGLIDVVILGNGFSRRTIAWFGSTKAVTTTYWSDTVLLCFAPPCTGAELVVITAADVDDEIRSIRGESQKGKAVFRYDRALD